MLTCLLGGCTVGPNFHPPVVDAPKLWRPVGQGVPSRIVSGEVDVRWWLRFRDPELSSLVDRLVAQNLDLRSAAERIVQGRSERQVAASQGLPTLNEQSMYTRERFSTKGFISLVQPVPGAPLEYDIFQNGLMSSWELDLFGKVRRSVEAADANVLASIESRRSLALSLLAELAQDYLQFRGTQTLLEVAERNLETATESTRLVRERFRNGVGTELDLAQAQSQQAAVASSVPPLRTQLAMLTNAIGLLLGEAPRALERELSPAAPFPAVPDTVPVGLPGELVRRRPDVREAEARLHAATAETGVAVASFYPDVTLTGVADLNGLRLRDAFSLPARAFDVGPSISIPLFQGGRLTGELRLRKSQQREAAIAFQKIVLTAWQDVDNALVAYAQAQQRRMQTAESVRQNEIALRAARQRYREGASDFLNVVSSEQQLLQSQNNLASDDTQIATDLVSLYRALGGGWEVVGPVAVPAQHFYDQ